MTTWVFGVFAIVMVGFAMRFFMRGADVVAWAERAAKSGDMNLLINHIETEEADPATGWDQAIGTLWDNYQREMAAKLVVEGAQRNDATVFQFWIRRFLEIEPELAEEHFTQEFLAEHFKPEVAMKCGKGCGCN